MINESKLKGGLYGLLIGDALGVPYEFHEPQNLPPYEQIEMVPPTDFNRTYPFVKPGTWSDDGAQALALLDSLLECEDLDLEDLTSRFVEWNQHGRYAVNSVVFDIGITTSRSLSNYMNGVPAQLCGSREENSNGNGSLMRVLPLVLWHKGDDESLIQMAMVQSLPTHAHLRSQVCCALYCMWARNILNETAQPWEEATATLRDYLKGSEAEEELEAHIRPDLLRAGTGSGYVVDSLISARWEMQKPDYESVVKSAVKLGKDTDTTACIAGGVAGLRDGFEAIPTRWVEALRGREILEPLWQKLQGWHS